MDMHTATEQAYKNGYQAGYEVGKRNAVIHCENCDLWNRWDYAGRKSFGNFVCSCAYWSNDEDAHTVYTKPDDFCSNAEPYEE